MEEAVIERAEVVALLFNVSDIAASLERIDRLLEELIRANAQRTRELAERVQAKLDTAAPER